jgi:hypothetical protein
MTRRPEQQIQKAVVSHLAWRGVSNLFVCHYPAGGYRTRAEGAILRSLGTRAGIPDLLIVYRGQLYALELKTESGRLTDTQSATHEEMKRAGVIVATAYGIDAALEQLCVWGLLRPDVSNQTANAFNRLRHDVARRARRANSPPTQERR